MFDTVSLLFRKETMKKLVRFARSMHFGLLLLGLITALSLVGTLIPQGQETAWYMQRYPGMYTPLLALKLDDVFHSWYFQLLLALLGLNLILCSLLRIRAVRAAARLEERRLSELPESFALSETQRERLLLRLRAAHCRESRLGESVVFRKNGFGRYGSFITHLSILLTLIFGALALYLPRTVDRSCLPGESTVMDDGTEIRVESFRIEDETGRLDFTSELELVLPDGRSSGLREISVNHPLSFGGWKIYQQTYGTAGAVRVKNLETEGEDLFTLTELVFLSLDGKNGLWYQAVYPDFLRDPSGNVTLITNTSGSYPNPVYQVETVSDGVFTPVLAFPGEELQIGQLRFHFEPPVEYPGLRIKHTPGFVNALLCAAFLLMIAGLYITFFCQPVLLRVDASGCAVAGPKQEGMRLTVRECIQESGENT